MVLLYVILLLVAIIVAYVKWTNSYWSRRNVKGPVPLPIFGNYLNYFLTRKHFGLVNHDIYRDYPKAAYVGVFRFGNPVILLRDLDLIKSVLVENFNNFAENDFFVDEKLDPLLAKSPFFSDGLKWKIHRSQTSPIFTASKLKSIYPNIQLTGKRFVEFVDSEISSQKKEFEVKMLFYKFAVENVASCLLSLEAEAFTKKDSSFSVNARKIFDTTFWQSILFALSVHVPILMKLIKVPLLPHITDEWFRSILRQILEKRKAGDRRNDFLQCLLDAGEKAKEPYSDDDVIGHCFTFLVEGFETSSITLAYCLFELSCHPNIFQRLRNEIDEALAENNGEYTEECFQAIPYLDQVIYESMRKNTPVYTLSRVCTKPIKFPPQYSGDSEGVTIESGVSVVTPVHSIHSDPEIYPNPHIFDPERFNANEISNRHKYAFLGFGEGPRICIGMKFAMMQMKMALASIVYNFDVSMSPTTKLPLEPSATTLMLHCDDGIWINFQKRIK